jgi:Tol biopolymer transport system component
MIWDAVSVQERLYKEDEVSRNAFLKQRIGSLDKLFHAKKVAQNAVKASWSPDGRKLAIGKSSVPHHGLQIVDLQTEETKDLLPFGLDPAWSPGEGRQIAFVRSDVPSGEEEIWIVESSGDNPRRITEGGFPSWSADGKTLFFHSRKKRKIFAIQPTEMDAPLTEVCNMLNYYPSFSSDSTQICYTDENLLHILDRETKKETLAIHLPTKGRIFPSWSPDGKQIGVGSYGFDSETKHGFWILDVETKTYRNIASGSYTMPVWSPDGSKIAIDHRNNERGEVWVIETKNLDPLK